MTTTAYAATTTGFITGAGTFSVNGALGLLQDNFNLAICEFIPTTDTNLAWINSSVLVPETSLSLYHPLGGFGAPYNIYVAARIDGTQASFPTTGQVLPNSWHIHSLGGEDYFQHPNLPASGSSPGQFVGKVRVASTPVGGTTTTVPVNLSALLPAATDQSWSKKLYLNIWVQPLGGAFQTYFTLTGANTAKLNLPSATLSVPNRDTGRSGNAWANSPYGRDPISGFASLKEGWVEDGYREGLFVDPRSYDPPEPRRRPLGPERPV